MSDNIDISVTANGAEGIDRIITAIERLHDSLNKLGSNTSSGLARLEDQMKSMQLSMTNGFKELAELSKKSGTEIVASQEAAASKILNINQRRDVELNRLRGQAMADYVGWWDRMLSIEEKRDAEMNAERQRAGVEYVNLWNKMLSERQSIQERRDMELHNQQTLAAKTTIEIEQRRDLELHAMRQKAAADAATQAEKQRVLNTNFNTASPTSQLNTARQAAEYGRQGGDVAARYGSAAASADIRALEEAHRRLQPAVVSSTGAIQSHNATMNEAHSLARGLAGSLGGLWLTYGSVVPLLAGAAIAGSLKNIVEVGKEVEHQLNFVAALTGTGVDLNKFLTITDSSLNSVVESANAMRMLAQNGLNATQALQVLPGVMDLAIVGEMNVGQAALAATGAVSAFGLSFSEAGRVADIFAKTAATSNTSVLAITESMKQASTVASLFKVSIEETAAMLGLLAKINITGGAAGTSMTNMLTGLYEPTEKGKRALKELGIQTQTATGALKPLTQLLGEMKGALASFNDSARVDILGSIFTVRGVKSAQLALENLGAFKQKTEEAATSAGFMRGVITKLEDDTDGAFKRLSVTVENTFTKSFKEAQPYVQQIGIHLADAFNSKDAQSGIANLATNVARLTGFLLDNAGAVAALGVAYVSWGALGPVVALLRTAASASLALTVANTSATAAQAALTAANIAGASTTALLTAAVEANAVATEAAAAATLAWEAVLLPALGAVAVAVAAGAALWLLFRDNTDEADTTNVRIGNSLHVVTEQLDKEIERLEKANALWDERNGKFRSEGAVSPAAITKAEEAVAKIESRIRKSGGNPDAAAAAVGQVELDATTGMVSTVAGYHELGAALVTAREKLAGLQEQDRRWSDTKEPLRRTNEVRNQSDRLRQDLATFYKKGTEVDDNGNFYQKDKAIRDIYQKADKLQQARIDPAKIIKDPEQEAARLDRLNVSLRQLQDEANKMQSSRAQKVDSKAVNDELQAGLRKLDLARQLAQVEASAAIAEGKRQNARGELGDLELINLERDKSIALYQTEIDVAKQKYDLVSNSDKKNKEAAKQTYENQQQVGGAKIQAEVAAAADKRLSLMANMAEQERKYEANTMKEKGDLVGAFLSDYEAQYRQTINKVSVEAAATEDEEYAKRLDAYLAYLGKLREEGVKANIAQQFGNQFDEMLSGLQQRIASLTGAGSGIGLAAIFDNAQRAAAEYQNTLPELIAKQKELQLAANNTDDPKIKKSANDKLKAAQSEAVQMRKIWVDYSKTIGSELEKAFGRGGKAAGDMITAALEFDSQRSQAQDRYEQSTKSTADKEKLSLDINSARIKSYGDMADAAAGFFDKGSKGYQTLSAVSKVFHMAELAMATAKLVPMAIAAVLNQGNGDPYTAFGRMAAMAALVAGLGVAVSAGGGGGGGRSAAEQQKIDGTGTVFGNSTAKSDSINKSLERIQKNTYQDVNVSQGMLASLQNIEAAMTGLSNLVLRTTGVVDGSNLKTNVGVTPGSKGLSIAGGASAGAAMGSFFGPIGTVIGGILGGIVGAVSSLWGKTTKTVIDSGLQLGGSVRDLQAGRGYNQYASVDTTKKSWFGLSKKTTNSVVTQSLGSDLSNQFAMVFNNLETSLKAAAVGMGVGADQVTSALDKLVIGVSTASLKDLKGDELTQALNALVSKVMDQMAAAAFPAMDRFSKVGEGYAETVLRVAADYQTIDAVFLSFGKTFGLVGASSLDAREQLIELSGGLEKFTSQGAYFLDNFFTDAEKRAALGKQLAPTLTKYGLSANSTQAAFKSVVLGLNTTTKAGAEAYAALMAIAPAFKSMTEAVESERRDLQDQLDELTMSSTQLLAKQRAAIDESNRALFDQVQAAKTAKDSIDSSRDSLTTFMGNMKDFATSVRDAAKSLLLGDLSTLTPEEKYAEARRQYNNTLTAARAGDTKAQNEFASIQSQFLTISQAINGSDSQYTADFNAALAASQELATWADSQANIAQSSLDALNAQLAALAAANATLSQIAAAVQPSPTNTTGVGSPSYDELVFELRLLREQQAAAALEAKRQRDAAIAANLAGQQAAAEHVAGTVSQTIMDNNYAQQIGEGIIQ